MDTEVNILGTCDVAGFLRDYWQKKPLFVRQALPGFVSPLSGEELAGLACEDGVEARLIGKSGDSYWLENGPFDEARFARLPKQDWTLLVQDVEKHLPELAGTLDYFSFIPHWRIDDLMISYAVDGGGVGPHTDAYDVFLLQAKGRRRWRIAEHFDPEIIPGLDIEVLKHFDSQQEWVLEPGDMLYLPPGVAHEGVALGDDCMTWSVGFRAPSLRDMFSDFSEWLFQKLPEDERYADATLAPWEAADGKISWAGFERMRSMLQSAMYRDNAELDRWFGQFMTEPKPWLYPEPSEDTPDAHRFVQRLRGGDNLLRDSRAMLAWTPSGDAAVFFVNGEAWDIPAVNEPLLVALCTRRRFEYDDIDEQLDEGGDALLMRLHGLGVLHFASVIENNN